MAASSAAANNKGPLGTLLFFSLLMIVCPLGTFFAVRSTFVTVFASEQLTASIVAAVCAVLAVHGVVALFVYKAYHEKDDGPAPVPVIGDRSEKVPQKID